MNSEEPARESNVFRFTIALVVMFMAGGGFIALFFIKVPTENKDAMMFALGNVFGWAASIVSSEYGATTTGRKVAESAIRKLENQEAAPLPAKVVEPDPLPVADEEKG